MEGIRKRGRSRKRWTDEVERDLNTKFLYTHLSLFTGSYYAVSQIRGVAPRIKIHLSDPSMGRSIKIVRQLDLEPHCVMFKGLRGRKGAAPITVFLRREEKHQKIPKKLFCSNYLRSCHFSRSVLELSPPQQKRGLKEWRRIVLEGKAIMLWRKKSLLQM